VPICCKFTKAAEEEEKYKLNYVAFKGAIFISQPLAGVLILFISKGDDSNNLL
jgi:hypothetical protein